MTDLIEFTNDDHFGFRLDGVRFDVHTEVGDGPARVVVRETSEHDEQPMEQSE